MYRTFGVNMSQPSREDQVVSILQDIYPNSYLIEDKKDSTNIKHIIVTLKDLDYPLRVSINLNSVNLDATPGEIAENYIYEINQHIKRSKL